MPAGQINNGISLKEAINLPLTASINKTSELTGISYQALKKLAESGQIVSIPVDGKKVLLSVWSVVEKFNLIPADILKAIWMEQLGNNDNH